MQSEIYMKHFQFIKKNPNKFYDFKIIDEAIVPLDANKNVSKKFASPLNLSRLLRSL